MRSLAAGAPAAALDASLPGFRARLTAAVWEESLLVGTLALLGLVLVVIAPLGFVQDSWMTLVAGREVAQHGIPHVETLTSLARGRRWIDQQWLAQLVFFEAWKLGGLKLVSALQALAIESAVAAGVVAARRRGASPGTIAATAMLVFALSPWLLQLRAQSLALVLFVVLYQLLRADSRSPSWRVLLCLPILALWANVHGSVVLGAGLVVVRCLTAVFGGRAPSRAAAARTLVLLVGAPLAVLASPYGLSLVHYYRVMLLDPPFARHIQEWQPVTFEPLTAAFFAVVLTLVVLATSFRGRLTRFEEAALLLLTVASLDALRNIVWFALAVLVSAPLLLDAVNRRDAPIGRRGRQTNLVCAGVATILAIPVAVVAPLLRDVAKGDAPAGSAIARLAARDPQLAILPDDAYADWLLWTQPQLAGRVAYDVRFELNTPAEVDALVRFREDVRTEPGLLRRYQLFMLGPADAAARRWLLAHGGRLVRHAPDLDVVLRTARSA